MKIGKLNLIKQNMDAFLFQAGKFLYRIIRFVIVFGLCFVILYPFVIKVLQMLMSPQDIFDSTVNYIPRHFSLYYIKKMMDMTSYYSTMLTGLWISLLSAAIQTAICLISGYGFARFQFKGKRLLFMFVIFTLLVPPQTLTTSLYMEFRFFGIQNLFTVNLLDTIFPFAILSITALGFKNGLFIYLARQNFRGMPKELEEAAYVDGYGPIRTFFRIILPNSISIGVIVFVLSFAWQFTDTFYTQIFTSNLMTFPVSIVKNINLITFSGGYLSSYEITIIKNCASIFLMIPLVMIFLVAQKNIIQGIERSGIVS